MVGSRELWLYIFARGKRNNITRVCVCARTHAEGISRSCALGVSGWQRAWSMTITRRPTHKTPPPPTLLTILCVFPSRPRPSHNALIETSPHAQTIPDSTYHTCILYIYTIPRYLYIPIILYTASGHRTGHFIPNGYKIIIIITDAGGDHAREKSVVSYK